MTDVFYAVGAQLGVAACSVLLYRLFAMRSGTDGFASYALVKQAVYLALPIILIGVTVGLPRCISVAIADGRGAAEVHLVAAVAIGAVSVGTLAAVMLADPEAAASLIFGRAESSDLIGPFSALLGATAFAMVAYGYLRGLLAIGRGAWLQLAALGLAPLAVVLALGSRPVSTLVLAMALGVGATSLTFVAFAIGRGLRAPRREIWHAARSLLDYGRRRVPGDIAAAVLFSVAPLILAHAGTLREVAFLTAGQQVLLVVAFAIVPIGLVLLPTLTRAWTADQARARDVVVPLTALAIHVGAFASIQALLFGDLAARAWLGSDFSDASTIVRITLGAGGLYFVYVGLRSVLDAVALRSYNSRNNVIAVAVFGVLAAILLASDVTAGIAVAIAFASGLAAQGALALFSVSRIFAIRPKEYELGTAMPLVAVGAAVGIAVRPLIPDSGTLAALISLEAALFAAYFAILWRRKVCWTLLLRERLLVGGR